VNDLTRSGVLGSRLADGAWTSALGGTRLAGPKRSWPFAAARRHRPGRARRDAKVSQATAYRYLRESARRDHRPRPRAERGPGNGTGRAAGWAFVCLDGTLIPTSRVKTKSVAGNDPWYSGKHHPHVGNIQVLTSQAGSWSGPPRSSRTRPTASPAPARTPCPPCIPTTAAGLPTLPDKGYTGAGSYTGAGIGHVHRRLARSGLGWHPQRLLHHRPQSADYRSAASAPTGRRQRPGSLSCRPPRPLTAVAAQITQDMIQNGQNNDLTIVSSGCRRVDRQRGDHDSEGLP